MKNSLPKFATFILRHSLPKRERDFLIHDYESVFNEIADREGLTNARLWYWKQVIVTIPSLSINKFYWGGVMFRNYLKTAYRNIKKNKIYSAINLSGLAVAIAAVIFISLYIQFQIGYDNFHINTENLFRLSVISERVGIEESDSHVFTPPIGPELVRELAEVKNYTRIRIPVPRHIKTSNNIYKVEEVVYADSTFFSLFTFDLLKGNESTVLSNPFAIVLSASTAYRIFGDIDPMGKSVSVDGYDYFVTGIVADPPENSHIKFDALISFETLYNTPGNYMGWNGGNQYITYIELNPNSTKANVESLLPEFMWSRINQELSKYNILYKPYLQPFADIHLKYSTYSENLRINLVIFSAVGIFILFIACINFINLSTARASRRRMEIGVRKMLGAARKSLIKQFLTESLLLSAFALFGAILIVIILIPKFNILVGGSFSVINLLNYQIISGLIGIMIVTGIFAGLYPAIVLSSYNPVKVFQKSSGWMRKGFSLRGILVISQFSISIVLIITTLFINEQLAFIKNKNLGFDRENILLLPLNGNQLLKNIEPLKEELQTIPGIQNISASSDVPYNGFTQNGYIPEGYTTPVMLHVVDTDENFLKTFNLELLDGRNFIKKTTGFEEGYIINESLAKTLGWDSPLGKIIERNGPHEVIGVVKNFHYAPLREELRPLIITNRRADRGGVISVKINSADISETIKLIENKWEKFASGHAFEFNFLDDAFDTVYRDEQHFRILFLSFSFLAIIIALLGLFGLSSFTLEQKFKEIAIRKVHGASVKNITSMMTIKFVRWVLTANIIAWPAAYYLMSKWLDNFAYKTDLSLSVFLFAGVIALGLSIATVGYQSTKAALKNPVDSLKYE